MSLAEPLNCAFCRAYNAVFRIFKLRLILAFEQSNSNLFLVSATCVLPRERTRGDTQER